jgi:hypothetical protein
VVYVRGSELDRWDVFEPVGLDLCFLGGGLSVLSLARFIGLDRIVVRCWMQENNDMMDILLVNTYYYFSLLTLEI